MNGKLVLIEHKVDINLIIMSAWVALMFHRQACSGLGS